MSDRFDVPESSPDPDDPNDATTPGDDTTSQALHTVLARPEVWAEPSASVEDDVLAAILGAEPEERSPATVERLPDRRANGRRGSSNRSRGRNLLAAAAVFLLAAVGTVAALELTRTDPADLEVALTGSDDYPAATAVATVRNTASGLSIVLEVDDLPPAPAGSFYAAWMVRPEPRARVPIGTFHLREGNEAIELWSGVEVEGFPVLSVTLQSEADPAGPGQPVLAGPLD